MAQQTLDSHLRFENGFLLRQGYGGQEGFGRPFRDLSNFELVPGTEVPGYCQMSLRDNDGWSLPLFFQGRIMNEE